MAASSFDQDQAWADRLGQVRDVVRQRLVADQLQSHLPRPTAAHMVVDVGCGQGTQVFALAERGYRVVGVDPSTQLLDLARRELGARTPDVQSRVTFKKGDLDSLGDVVGRPADILLCHGVLMYLPTLAGPVAMLTNCLARGGILSLLTRNQAGIAMRAGMEQRWTDAVNGFGANHYTNNLGVENARADAPEEVISACEVRGLEVVAWYGVRLFTDHWRTGDIPDDIDSVIEAERQAGSRDPYRRLAALTHVIAQQRVPST